MGAFLSFITLFWYNNRLNNRLDKTCNRNKKLAKKYKLTAQQVSNKAGRDKWTKQKNEIQQKTQENIQSKIQIARANTAISYSFMIKSNKRIGKYGHFNCW